jgi:hypothetical protein
MSYPGNRQEEIIVAEHCGPFADSQGLHQSSPAETPLCPSANQDFESVPGQIVKILLIKNKLRQMHLTSLQKTCRYPLKNFIFYRNGKTIQVKTLLFNKISFIVNPPK